MDYTPADYARDLENPDLVHIKNKEHFKAFYTELGKGEQQKKQGYIHDRMKFVVPEGRIVELGCHAGFNLIYYANQGFDVIGVDVSPTLLDAARYKISTEPPEIGKKIRLVESFIEDWETMLRFDTIIITEVLEHCIDPLAILKKANKLLRNDGRIYISAPCTKTGNSSHVRGFSQEQMQKLIDESGLTMEKLYVENTITFAVVK